jgi:hypothetical protein
VLGEVDRKMHRRQSFIGQDDVGITASAKSIFAGRQRQDRAGMTAFEHRDGENPVAFHRDDPAPSRTKAE